MPVLSVTVASIALLQQAAPPSAKPSTPGPAPAFTDRIKGTAVAVEMMAIPGCDGTPAFWAGEGGVPELVVC